MTEQGPPPWPRRPALFLDLDGTLVELTEHPSLTQASPRLRRLLPRLVESCGGAVAVISGRRIEEVDRVLAPHAGVAAGVHGLERRGPDGTFSSFAPTEELARIRHKVEPFVARHEGLWIEDKRSAFAVHYRNRPELEEDVHRFVAALEREIPPDIEILLGRCVFEIKPGAADKGRAIELFMAEAPFAGRTPVFVGDDVTDEAGFRVVNALGGVSVKVGEARTIARWRLANVDDVLGWLERLASG
ncbi:MAG TPA: trehalose-phosphatase [Gammaproteobacteria bacterium]